MIAVTKAAIRNAMPSNQIPPARPPKPLRDHRPKPRKRDAELPFMNEDGTRKPFDWLDRLNK